MCYHLSMQPNHFQSLVRNSHPTTVIKRCHLPLFMTEIVAKLLKSTNTMFHSKTSLLKDILTKKLCPSLSLLCSLGGLVLTSANCRLLCQSDVSHYVALCVCLFSCMQCATLCPCQHDSLPAVAVCLLES